MLIFDKVGIAYWDTYIHTVRPHIVCNGSPLNFFLSWNGKPMTSGKISRQINSQWVKAGIFNESLWRNISCNIIRKTVVTAAREEELGHEQEVADLMGHSWKTAGQSYYLRQKLQTAGDARSIIREHFSSGNVPIVVNDENGGCEDHDKALLKF